MAIITKDLSLEGIRQKQCASSLATGENRRNRFEDLRSHGLVAHLQCLAKQGPDEGRDGEGNKAVISGLGCGAEIIAHLGVQGDVIAGESAISVGKPGSAADAVCMGFVPRVYSFEEFGDIASRIIISWHARLSVAICSVVHLSEIDRLSERVAITINNLHPFAKHAEAHLIVITRISIAAAPAVSMNCVAVARIVECIHELIHVIQPLAI